jgi:Insertion element 4 transposase N-terminal
MNNVWSRTLGAIIAHQETRPKNQITLPGVSTGYPQLSRLDAAARVVPLSEIKAALTTEAVCAQRERKLNMVMPVLVTIAMNFYVRISLGAVLHKIAQGLRYIWPDPEYPVAQSGAFSYRRYQVGLRPLAKLFHRVCRPMATPANGNSPTCQAAGRSSGRPPRAPRRWGT